MVIIESKAYKKNENKILKNQTKELEKLEYIKNAIVNSNNLHALMLSPFKYIYNIRKKDANLKEYYSASLNERLRLIFKPIGKYPYNEIEITELEFIEINKDELALNEMIDNNTYNQILSDLSNKDKICKINNIPLCFLYTRLAKEGYISYSSKEYLDNIERI